MNQHLKVLKTKGKVVVVGLVAGVRSGLRMDLLLGKRATIRGTVLRSRGRDEKRQLIAEFRKQVLPALGSGDLKPQLERVFSAVNAEEAHAQMQGNKTFGKMVLAW